LVSGNGRPLTLDELRSKYAPKVGGLTSSDVAAITDYTAESYRKMNWEARGIKPPTPEIQAKIKTLDKVLEGKTLSENFTLYRGLGGAGTDAIIAQGLNKGNVIVEMGFLSASCELSVGKEFASVSNNNLLLKINAKRGSSGLDISQISDNKEEKEILLPRNARLKIVKLHSKTRILEVDYE